MRKRSEMSYLGIPCPGDMDVGVSDLNYLSPLSTKRLWDAYL